ncbi:uricase [Actinocatenispora thailandica]|uniref:Uricase n=1 Tax=Actinocatenispora thailandica TaxID=227318 RepID=A0A7R7DMH8_9ACTN|nr:urate oxidase [Actinocatenispora thailandica]BCJ34317.1 uricase [Actinocatenispora thailandica]
MGIVLGDNRYGKAEVHLVRVDRAADRHALADVTVSVSLSGELADVHLRGDNRNVLTTDAQKNTVFAFAADGVGQIEEFGLRLARHFVASQPAIRRAVVRLTEQPWDRIEGDGGPAPHSFARNGTCLRTAQVCGTADGVEVGSGLTGLTLLNTTDSEFWGFARDRYTTLAETRDRVLATAVDARWRHRSADGDFGTSYRDVRRLLTTAFAETYSYSLQQTLYAMGERVLAAHPEIAEIRLSLPNKHHFLVDLSPHGIENADTVYYAADRPYGLIEGTVTRDDAAPSMMDW